MQVHSLSVAAFGPFADRQQVDFDALADGGLFLFHGPTGAGKTSVLDAVCFALYGQVPGARATGRELRSDHASPGARPEVILELTLRGRRLRVTRSPQWDRPKHRGSGTTIEQSRVVVEECTGNRWTTLSTRLDEAGQLIGALLGLSLQQFCQVVLLPQGQFAEFLRADPDRRRALLESLFDTARFADIERWLVGERQTARRLLDDADQQLADVVARVAEAAAADPPDAAAAGAPDVAATLHWVAALRTAADAEVVVVEAQSPSVDQLRDEAVTALATGQRTCELQGRHRSLTQRLRQVEHAALRRAAVVDEIRGAQRAVAVLPLVHEVTRLDELLDIASGDLVVRRRRVLADAAESSSVDAGLDALRSRVETTQAELGGLAQLRQVEHEAAEMTASISRFERDVVAFEQQRDELKRWLAEATPRREALRKAVDEALRATEGVGSAEAVVVDVECRREAAARRDRLDAEMTAARSHFGDATDRVHDARGRWLDLRAARIEGMAAELASTLVPGTACPVCGSADHPAPTDVDAAPVTLEQEKAAEREVAAAESRRASIDTELTTMTAARAAATALAGEQRTVREVDTELSTARAALDVLRRTAASLPVQRDALAALEREIESRSQEQLRQQEQARATRLRSTETTERLAAIRARLDAARGADPTVAARAARLGELVDHLDGLARALADVERLSDEVSAATERALSAARAQGMDSLDEVSSLARPGPVVVELEEFRRRHDEEATSVRALLDDPELDAASTAPVPDLELLTSALREAEQLHSTHIGRLTAARQKATALARLLAQLDAVVAARAPLAERHAVVDGLSRLAEGKSGDNRLRMSLSGYVLAARLEQVATAASERLLRMSSGRYQLVHTAHGGSSRGRGGLHLRVLDAWTGAERDPSSLSGGETFSASLSLALGLADVVTSEAGGSLLETLFVDEGFGSLDDETLDEVLSVLDDLREGGRVVGLVSHVADLRQRIPVQLHVDKGRSGSTIRQ